MGCDSAGRCVRSRARPVKRRLGHSWPGSRLGWSENYSHLSQPSFCLATMFAIPLRIVEEDRIIEALARIDAATTRLERAASRPAAPADAAQGDPELESRHAALRKETSIAIAEMDALLKELAS